MSVLIAVGATALLFTLFGVLRRGSEPERCGDCPGHCGTCVHSPVESTHD